MTRSQVSALLLVCISTLAGAADEVSGHLEPGFRNVSVDGHKDKYDEDVNLQEGPRLFSAALDYRANGAVGLRPEQIEINLDSLGGDPYESARFEMRKYGAYHLIADRQWSDYFYHDIVVLPENADIAGSTGGDFHRFDFERVRDNVSLGVDITDRAKLDFGFQRYHKHGESTTTIDISRDEFELEKPIDETMRVFSVGLQYNWDKLTLSFEERINDFENDTQQFLPEFSSGENKTDLTTLDFFFLNQPYSYRSYEHIVRARATPIERLNIALSAAISDLDLDLDASEHSRGRSFIGEPLSTNVSGEGGIERHFELYAIDLAYAMTERVQLVAGFKRHQLDQSGRFLFGQSEGGRSSWDIDTNGFNLGLLVVATSSITFSAGWSGERRDVKTRETEATGSLLVRDVETDSNGFYGTLDYRPTKRFGLSASIDDRSIDDPFSLASATDSTRYRVRGRYQFDNGIALIASHTRTNLENEAAAWSADTSNTTARLSYTGISLVFGFGGSMIERSQDFRRVVLGGFRRDLFNVIYDAETVYADAGLRWNFTQRWAVGGSYRLYDNDGSFDVNRDDGTIFVESNLLRHYTLRLSYRNVDYSEGGIEAYDADLIEATIRFDF